MVPWRNIYIYFLSEDSQRQTRTKMSVLQPQPPPQTTAPFVPTPAPPVAHPLLNALQNWAQDLIISGKLPSVVLGLSLPGGDVQESSTSTATSNLSKSSFFTASHGYQNVEKQILASEDSLYRLLSLSKPLTTLAALILLERGAFELDQPIATLAPEFHESKMRVMKASPESMKAASAIGVGLNLGFQQVPKDLPPPQLEPLMRPITFFHLLSHTAGFSSLYTPDNLGLFLLYKKECINFTPNAVMPSSRVPLPELIKRLATIPLLHQPGDMFSYGVGTDVLGYLIETMTKKPLMSFVEENIFIPLGISSGCAWVPPPLQDRLAESYRYKQGLSRFATTLGGEKANASAGSGHGGQAQGEANASASLPTGASENVHPALKSVVVADTTAKMPLPDSSTPTIITTGTATNIDIPFPLYEKETTLYPTSSLFEPWSFTSGGDGFLCGMRDLLRITHLIANEGELDGVRLLSKNSVRLMFTNHLPGSGSIASSTLQIVFSKLTNYGFGFGGACVGAEADPPNNEDTFSDSTKNGTESDGKGVKSSGSRPISMTLVPKGQMGSLYTWSNAISSCIVCDRTTGVSIAMLSNCGPVLIFDWRA